MEIQGGLIQLGENNHLPVPWQLRAFLGLQSGARAYVGVTRPSENHPPDIILSPIALEKLPYCYKLITSHTEEKLSFNAVLGEIKSFSIINIAIADSVTIEGRTRHVSTLVLEPVAYPPEGSTRINNQKFQLENYVEELDKAVRKIESALNARFGAGAAIIKRIEAPSNYLEIYPVYMKNGFIQNSSWYHLSSKNMPKSPVGDLYNTRFVVCSGNTENSYIRYIFPAKDSLEISISHRDISGALFAVTSLIGESGFNILSSRLSRTPPKGLNTEISRFVAVCEPQPDRTADNCMSMLSSKLDTLMKENKNLRHGISKPNIKPVIQAAKSVFLSRADGRTISMPAQFSYATDRIIEKRDFSGDNRIKIFLCYKFFGRPGDPNVLLIDAFKDIIKQEDMHWVDASIDEENDTTYDYIQASLWMSDACIVLAFNEEGRKYTGNLSVNQTHEIGFMHGQMKPFKIVVHQDRFGQARFSNLPDHQFLTYKDDATAALPKHPDYIGRKLKTWLQSVKRSRS
ncbi:ACT domain-containing protein [uncultured Caulobacter sp.]|uniref:ACT domain-containing protein n=1 Tax=uncultured Caulobacter sp. TaxID=158749 RepID=UPI002625EFA7|nr:ACT domain-containing protein [uncultured Caulobacter sp.]